MLVYLITLLTILYSVHICDIKGVQKLKPLFFLLELIILVLIISFQWRMGVDNLAYEDYFYDVPKLTELDSDKLVVGSQFQPFWYVLLATIKMVDDSYQFFLIIHAVIINVVILFFFKRNTPYVFTAILFYILSMSFFYFNLDILRESLAVSCFLASVRFLRNRRFKKYYICCFVAFLFHISALFLFLVPLFLKYIERVYSVKKVIITMLAFTVPFVFIFNFVVKNIAASGALALIMSQADFYNSLEKNLGHSLIMAIFSIIPAVSMLYIRNRMKLPNDICVLLTYVYVFLVFCNAFITGLYRVSNYFLFPYYVCVANTIYNSIPKFKRLTIISILIMVIIVVYDYSTPIGDDSYAKVSHYIPYRTIFD